MYFITYIINKLITDFSPSRDLSYNKDLNGPLPKSIGELKKLSTL